MKRGGETKCSEMGENLPSHTKDVLEPECKRLKPDVLLEMGLAMLDDEDDPCINEAQSIVTSYSPYARAEPVETRLIREVTEDTRSFSSPFSEDFLLYKRRKSQVQGGLDLFNKLSDEMVLSVFRWLPKKTLTRCALVCRRWRRVAYDEELWTRLDLGCKSLTQGCLGEVLKRGVRILRLAQAEVPNPVFFKDSLPDDFCSRLQFLDLSMAVMSEEGLTSLLQRTKHLIKLSVEHCNLSEEACEAIAQNTQLEVLDLSLCSNLSTSGVVTVMTGCQRLQALNMGWTGFRADTLDGFMTCLPEGLKRLNLSGCRHSLTDKHVERLVVGCPQLMELDLSDAAMLTGASIDAIAQLDNLEHLSLSRCYHIPGPSMLKLGDMECLRYLDLFGLVSEQNLTALQQNLPAIELNKFMFSSIARPTVGIRRTSIWGLRVRD